MPAKEVHHHGADEVRVGGLCVVTGVVHDEDLRIGDAPLHREELAQLERVVILAGDPQRGHADARQVLDRV